MKVVHLVVLLLMGGAVSAYGHDHPKSFAGGNGDWFNTLPRPDNDKNPDRDAKSKLCCTNEDVATVQTRMELPPGGKYEEAVWYVWINVYRANGKLEKDWVRVPEDKIVHERPPNGDEISAYIYLMVSGTAITCFVPPPPPT
jgi:hypothetical protein